MHEQIIPKVFCIGFPKTGTTSLASALHLLGYRVTGAFSGVESISSREEAIEMISDKLDVYDAFQDSPYPYIYKYLDKREYDSKFILTVRDEVDWFESCIHEFGRKETNMREWVYGYGRGAPVGNKKEYIKRFKRHNKNVKNYFDGRGDLMVSNLAEENKWAKICEFLGVPKPPLVEFPHVRKKRRWRRKGQRHS